MKKSTILITIIFLVTFGLRLLASFSSTYFSDDESYFILRQVEHIIDHKVPLYKDDLSYSGRTYIFSPIYHYILAFASVFIPLGLAVKIIPNIIASLMVVIIYLLTRDITKNQFISFLTAITSIFIPIFLSETVSSLNPISLILFLSFLGLYWFMNLKKNLTGFIILMVILSILTPLSLLFIFGLLIYLLLCKLTGIKNSSEEKEVIVFSTFFTLWFQFILYKNEFLTHSLRVIWQNVPQGLLSDYFTQFSIPQAIYQIGFILFLCGIYVVYNNLFREKNRKVYLFFSMAIASIVLLWFKLIQYETGLIILGFVFVILFGYFMLMLFEFIRRIQLEKINNLVMFILILFIVIGSVIPSVIETYVSRNNNNDDVRMFKWINKNLPEDTVVLVPVRQAHTYTYYSGRKNVMDSHFLLIDDVDNRLEAIDEIYQTGFKSNAVRDLNKFDINYVALTKKAKEIYGIDDLKYADEDCFKPVYDDNGKIYQSLCVLEEK